MYEVHTYRSASALFHEQQRNLGESIQSSGLLHAIDVRIFVIDSHGKIPLLRARRGLILMLLFLSISCWKG